jgi:myosin heavy subunit
VYVGSGESGAGKTEATKQALNYLAFIAGSSSGIQSRILQANPILEGWGNAKTLRNNNSSRFGKYIEIWFDSDNTIVGSSNTTYILEKSRVVFQSKAERNYHVFYQLLQGASVEILQRYHLIPPGTDTRPELSHFYYINQSGCITIEEVDDAADHHEMNKAFEDVGFTEDDRDSLYHTVAGILQLGNINFLPNGDESLIDPATEMWFQACTDNFGADVDFFRKALLFRKIKSGGGKRMSVAFSPYNPAAAIDNRDALAKEIYNRCFDWIVAKINRLMFNDSVQAMLMIGILDIFGFEIFQKVSLLFIFVDS